MFIAATVALSGLAGAAIAANGGDAPVRSTRASPAARRRRRRTKTPAERAPAVSLPKIIHVVCVPKSSCSGNPHQVTSGGRLQITGTTITAGMLVVFPPARGAHAARAPMSSLHHSALGLIVAVPRAAATGKIYVVSGTRRSKSYGPISIVSYKLHPPPPPPPPAPKPTPAPAPTAPAAPAPTTAGRLAVRRSGHVDLVRRPVRRGRPRQHRRPGQGRRRHHGVRQELRRLGQLLVAVLAHPRADAARQRPEGVRVAVRVRHLPGRRGGRSAPRRWPTARTAWSSTPRSSTRDATPPRRPTSTRCAPRSARASPSGSRPSRSSTTTRPSPTRCSSVPAAPSTTCPRCTGRTSASRSTPCTPTRGSPTASTGARSSRSARPTPTRRPATSCASARRPSTTGRAAGRSGTGRRPTPPAGRRSRRRWHRSPP